MKYKDFFQFLLPKLTLAVMMNVIRIFLVGQYSYVYMNWNLFLALFPLLFLFLFEREKNIFFRILTFLLWILFLPNSVYLVSDFIHIRNTGPEWILWYDGIMLFLYASIGIFVNAFMLLKMKKILFPKKNIYQRVFVILIAILTSFGIYLGRYLRFNSWDIFYIPSKILSHSINLVGEKINHPVFLTTIFFYSLLIYVTTRSFQKIIENKNS